MDAMLCVSGTTKFSIMLSLYFRLKIWGRVFAYI